MPTTKEKTKEAPSSAEEAFSKGVKDFQEVEKECTTAARRVAASLLTNIESWEKKRDDLTAEKGHGALEDGLENLQGTLRSTLKDSIDISLDLMNSLNKMASRSNPFKR